MKKAFITGITGQDGSYLAEFLLTKGYQVIGLVYSDSLGTTNIDQIKSKLVLVKGDLGDYQSLKQILTTHKPDEIYNLGGITFVPASWEKPVLTSNIDALGPARLLQIIKQHLPQCRFYQASTAKIFGDPKNNPQTESTPIKPLDPYATAKASAHFMVQNFRTHFKLYAVAGILYNHESERRGENFVTRKITMSAAKIKLGQQDKLALGNLEAKQDWGYAPDYVQAMWLMLQQDQPDDYIIATGQLHSVKDILEIAFGELGLKWQDYVVRDPRFYRQEIAKALYGDAHKASQGLGWKPKTSFSDMIRKMTQYDYQLLKTI